MRTSSWNTGFILGVRACLKNYSHNLHAPPRGIFCPNSVVVARYGAFIVTYILQKTFFKHALAGFHPLLIIFFNPAEALTDSVKSQAGIQK